MRVERVHDDLGYLIRDLKESRGAGSSVSRCRVVRLQNRQKKNFQNKRASLALSRKNTTKHLLPLTKKFGENLLKIR